DCTENMTNTEIAPAPAPAPEAPAPVPETPAPAPAAPAPVPETPASAPETPAPVPETPAPVPETLAPAPESTKGGLQIGIDVTGNVDTKFVCKSGCKDSNDANTVLNLRVNLEKEFQPRLDHFYNTEVPSDCTEKRSELLGGLLSSLAGLQIDAKANANV
ncbi:hypothetical protein BGZ98_001267, partial [Dissophora globulifera]